MPEFSISPAVVCADRREGGGKHPVLAVVAFLGAFLFIAPAFIFDQDNFLIVAPCGIGSFSCSILFMRLLIGPLGRVKWSLVQAWIIAGLAVGRQWYIVALLGLGVVLCSFIIDRLLGPIVPLVRVPDKRRV